MISLFEMASASMSGPDRKRSHKELPDPADGTLTGPSQLVDARTSPQAGPATIPQADLLRPRVLAEIDVMRQELRHTIRDTPAKWTDGLRKFLTADAIAASNSIEGFKVSTVDVVDLIEGEHDVDISAENLAETVAYQHLMTYIQTLHDAPDFTRPVNRGVHSASGRRRPRADGRTHRLAERGGRYTPWSGRPWLTCIWSLSTHGPTATGGCHGRCRRSLSRAMESSPRSSPRSKPGWDGRETPGSTTANSPAAARLTSPRKMSPAGFTSTSSPTTSRRRSYATG